MLDRIDEAILSLLQEDARLSNAEIARRVGMAPSATFERIRKLEERGVIEGYETRLNAQALGRGFLAFMFVTSNEQPGDPSTAEALARIPEALEVHNIAGEDCFLLKVRVRDPEALARLIRERIGAIRSVRSTRTTIALETLKETSAICVGEGSRADHLSALKVRTV